MKIICEFLGGSHSYGLNTPASDEDVRGVFVHTDPRFIVGLGRYEHQENIADGNDIKHKEFRAFVNLLKKGNSEAIEALFLPEDQFTVLDPIFVKLRNNRDCLIDPERLFKVLLGYMSGELRLANGERTGKLGGKRKAQIDKYGFSPKNFVQLFRLAWAGRVFFKTGEFPVNIVKADKGFADKLLVVKTHPENFNVKELNAYAAKLEKELKAAFDEVKPNGFRTGFDDELANRLVVETYKDILNA